MKKVLGSLMAVLMVGLFSSAANAVLTTPTAAPDYKDGQNLYYNPAVVATNNKCKFDTDDFEKTLAKLQKHYQTAMTPIVVIEQRGTTSANDALTTFRTGQTLPDSNVTVFVTCSNKGVSAAGYGGKLFQQYVSAEQWNGIMKLAAPNLKVAADKFALQVVQSAMDQIETGALSQAQAAVDAKAAADKAVADAAALKQQQDEVAARAQADLDKINDQRNGGSHWVAYVVTILVVGFVVVWFLRRKSNAQVK